MSDKTPARLAYETLLGRVQSVANLDRRTAIEFGLGRTIWIVGLPVLLVLLVQLGVGLPFYVRAFVLPLVAIGVAWSFFAHLFRPLRHTHSTTSAAMLVESGRPELKTRLVNALELFHDLESPKPRFDSELVEALVLHAQQSTRDSDFLQVVDRGPAKKEMLIAGVTIVAWLVLCGFNFAGVSRAAWSMASAWGDMRDLAQKAAGAKIEVAALDRAYLVGSTIAVHATQHGFHHATMSALIRPEGETQWSTQSIDVNDAGDGQFVVKDAKQNFEVYFSAGMIESAHVLANVTERPRIASLTVEYQYPEYVRRAPVVQPRSDGNLKTLLGSNVVLTVEANKPLKSVRMVSKLADKVAFSVGGRFANGVMKLDSKSFFTDPADPIQMGYSLVLTDDFGFSNADADKVYKLAIDKDKPPTITFVGLPHRSSADEPHILEKNLGNVSAVVKAGDDYGLAKITLHYRVESLDNGTTKFEKTKERSFVLPPVDISGLPMLRLSETGATVGDRIVFWAEAQDAYDLEPDLGPHKVKTPAFRIAVVTEEEMLSEVAYKDDWSTQWYDSLKVASLSNREVPARMSPTAEPPTAATIKLLEASQTGESLRGTDQQLVQDYFDSLNMSQKEHP